MVERKILTPEEEIRWFLKHLDEITLEMRRGVFRVIFLSRVGRNDRGES